MVTISETDALKAIWKKIEKFFITFKKFDNFFLFDVFNVFEH